MQYDVLDMPGRGIRSNITYSRPVHTVAEYAQADVDATNALYSRTAVLQEEQDENGETIYRRVPRTTYPKPDSHYVVVRDSDAGEIAWQIYAGPFDMFKAMEIAEALRTRADKE